MTLKLSLAAATLLFLCSCLLLSGGGIRLAAELDCAACLLLGWLTFSKLVSVHLVNHLFESLLYIDVTASRSLKVLHVVVSSELFCLFFGDSTLVLKIALVADEQS